MAAKFILIGEGDDRVEAWGDEFNALMTMIEDTLRRMAKHHIVIRWSRIIPKNEDWRKLKRSGLSSYTTAQNLIEVLDGVDVDYETWGGDMPGRSGCWIRVSVESGKRENVFNLLTDVAKRLHEQWANSKAAAAEQRDKPPVSETVNPQREFWDSPPKMR